MAAHGPVARWPRAATGIDQNVNAKRALWVLADAMRRLRT
jgi:hypothetical protein